MVARAKKGWMERTRNRGFVKKDGKWLGKNAYNFSVIILTQI